MSKRSRQRRREIAPPQPENEATPSQPQSEALPPSASRGQGEQESPTGRTPPAPRPNLEDFERWLKQTMAVKLLVVIVIAFLSKVFVPTGVSFTLGLAVGLAVLVAVYLVDWRRKQKRN